MRDRLEYERKYNRPVEDEANQATSSAANNSGEGYNPITNGKPISEFLDFGKRKLIMMSLKANMSRADQSSIEGWNFNNNLPNGVGFGYGAGFARRPNYNQVFEGPPQNVNIFLNVGGNNFINTGDN